MSPFMLCSEVDVAAGMDGTRPLTSLSAWELDVLVAGIDTAVLNTDTAGFLRFFVDMRAKQDGLYTIEPGGNTRGRRKSRDPDKIATFLTPPEVRRRFGVVVDRPIPMSYARLLARRDRKARTLEALLRRSDNIAIDTLVTVFTLALDEIDPVSILIDKLTGSVKLPEEGPGIPVPRAPIPTD